MNGPRRRCARALSGIAVLGIMLPLVSRTDSVQASSSVNLHLTKTVGSASVSPVLSISLNVDKRSAIPRDTLTYTATVSNTGSVLAVSGDLTAQNTDTVNTATLSSYFDDISTGSSTPCDSNNINSGHTTSQWTPLAGVGANQPGYTPIVPAPITTGMRLQLVPVPTSGVAYPSSGDLILGTRIAPGSTATWHYVASVALTPAQTATLTKVTHIRNSFHAEPTPRSQSGTGQPPTFDIDFCQTYISSHPSGAASNVSVTVTPQGQSPVTVDQSTVPGLASIASGSSVSVTVASIVPRVSAKGSTESDADYLARLAAVEGSTVQATATAAGTGSGGPITAGPAVSPATTLHLPIVGIAKSGPANADAGTTQTYPLNLANSGGAVAGPLAVTDAVPSGATGTVTGVPATLNPGASATAQASFAIPLDQPDGGLTDTASVTWQDANGNSYGPVSSMFTTTVRASLSGATLTLAPAAAGPDPVGTQQTLVATFLDRNNNPAVGKTVSFTVTGANPTSGTATTDANGNASFTYTGANAGVDVAQASFTQGALNIQSNTATVGWIVPITPISTSTVNGNFFAEASSATTFVAKPGDAPAFGQNFPTIDFNPPAGINLWLGNDANGNLFETDTGGVVLAQQSLAVTGVATDGASLYVADPHGGITKRTLDGATVLDSMSAANAGNPSEDLAWDTKRNVLWRIDHAPPTLDEIDVSTHTLLHAYALPTSDAAAPAMTPLGGLGLAYDPGNDRLYLSFCQQGCSSLGQGLVRIADPSTGSIVGDLFQAPFMTGGLGLDTGNDTLWVGGDGVVRNMTLHGAVLNSFARPQPGGFVDGLEVVRTTKTPIVNHNISGVGPQTRPFTDVTTDQLGNFTGTIVAQGNGVQAGTGSLQTFDAELNANFTVAKAGDVTFDIVADDGFLLGISGGAARVSGSYENAPASNTSPFLNYPLMGAFNQQGGNTPATYQVTVHFPSAGSYPYELDYFECCGSELSLTMTIEKFTADTSPLSVYVAYADGLRPAGSIFPFPWDGSPGVTFVGNGSTPYDSGALRFDNSSGSPIVLGDVAVDIGTAAHFDLWGNNVTVAPHGITILTQTSGNNFDSSDQPITCTPTGVIPQVHYTPPGGSTVSFADTMQVLNTKGFDPPSCGGGNESISWTRIGGGGTPINVPLPPAAALSLTPATVTGDSVGSAQALTVTALDGSGNPVANQPVSFGIFGANTQTLSATTDANGVARTSYTGANAGTDTVTATALITGLRNVSNAVTIPWVIPAPASQPPPTSSGVGPPTLANLVPANGAVVSSPTQVTATISAPAGGSIASYSVTLQNTSTNATTTIGSGSGAPASPLANLDPALFSSGTYVLAVAATSGAGGTATLSNLVTLGSGGGAAAPPPPAISTPSPPDGATVTKPVPVSATFAPPSGQTIASWQVTYQALDPGPVVTLASGTGTPPSPLVTFDPTVLPNDTYAINISATASGGGTQTVTSTVIVSGNLKLGRFKVTYQDLSVPVGSFQMQVDRSYDSIDKQSADFGTGWKVSLSNFRTSSNHVLGLGGWTQYNTFCAIGLCLTAFSNSAPRYVTVTFPDQHDEIFDFTPSGGTNIFFGGNAAFTPRASTGTTSTLVALGCTSLGYTLDGNLYGCDGNPYNPTQFQLTTKAGQVLVLDITTGLVSETDSSGNSLTVDSGGVHSSTGDSITFTRDAMGRITDVTGPIAAQHLHYSYPSNLNELQAVTDPNGNTDTYTYDPISGNLQTVSGPSATPAQTLGYDSSGRLVSIQNGSEPPITISSSVGGQQQTILDPNGKLTTVMTFDNQGNMIEEDQSFASKVLQTLVTYDPVGRPTSITDPSHNQVTYTYDETAGPSNGNMLTFTDGAHRTWQLSNYNSFGEPQTVVQPDNSVLATIGYDSTTGALTSVQRPGEAASAYSYYPTGLVRTITDPGGRTTSYAYDSNGNLSAMTDSLNRSISLVTNSAGEVTSVTDRAGNPTAFTYWPDGQVKTMTDADNHTWQYAYDGFNRIASVTDPLLHSSGYQYNSIGKLSQITDRNNAVTGFSYDVDGNLTQELRPGNDATNYTYDPLSRLIESDNASSRVDRTYNDSSLLATETTCAPTASPTTLCAPTAAGASLPTTTMSYTYWPDGKMQTAASSASGTVHYAYNALGRLSSILDAASRPFGFGYDTLGRLQSITRPNGVNDLLGYSPSNDLTSRDASLNSSVVSRADYGTDPVTGRNTSFTDLDGVHSFTYDNNGALLSASNPAASGFGNESYTYDAAGNRTSWAGNPSTAVASDSADRLSNDASFAYVYDNEGDLLSKTPIGGGTPTTYDWNADHELRAIHYPNGTSSTYTYDPFGRRVQTSDPGGTVRHAYDGGNVRDDFSAANALTGNYVTGGLGSVLEIAQGGQPSYPLADALGSVRELTDPNGAVSGTYRYDSYGRPGSGNPSASTYTYAGHQFDPASGLYNMGLRYYDPSTGRFLSEDPIPAVNPYPYVENSPTNLTDPTGGEEAVEEASIDSAVDVGANVALKKGITRCLVGAFGAIAETLTSAAVTHKVNPYSAAGGIVSGCVVGALIPDVGPESTSGEILSNLLRSTVLPGAAAAVVDAGVQGVCVIQGGGSFNAGHVAGAAASASIIGHFAGIAGITGGVLGGELKTSLGIAGGAGVASGLSDTLDIGGQACGG